MVLIYLGGALATGLGLPVVVVVAGLAGADMRESAVVRHLKRLGVEFADCSAFFPPLLLTDALEGPDGVGPLARGPLLLAPVLDLHLVRVLDDVRHVQLWISLKEEDDVVCVHR